MPPIVDDDIDDSLYETQLSKLIIHSFYLRRVDREGFADRIIENSSKFLLPFLG